jgi:hypothetical protein
MQAEWRHDPAVGKNARLHRFEKAHSPHRAIAAAMMARPARTAPDGKLLQQHREARFQHFGIGQAAVGHVRLHHRRSVEIWPGARSAGDRLVVLVARVAEGEVVHRPLRPRHRAQRAEQRVGHHLAGLDIPGHHGGGRLRAQHRPFGHHHGQRAQASSFIGTASSISVRTT